MIDEGIAAQALVCLIAIAEVFVLVLVHLLLFQMAVVYPNDLRAQEALLAFPYIRLSKDSLSDRLNQNQGKGDNTANIAGVICDCFQHPLHPQQLTPGSRAADAILLQAFGFLIDGQRTLSRTTERSVVAGGAAAVALGNQ